MDDGVYKLLYDGQWINSNSKELIEIISPCTNLPIGKIQALSKVEVDTILLSSKNAQKQWSMVPLYERAKLLHKAASILEENLEQISNMLQLEISKDKASSESEIKRTADFIRYTADAGKNLEGEALVGDNFPGFSKNKLSFITRHPLGVVLAISPFNYPINLAASKIAPALISGNSVVLKPATQGAISSLMLCDIFKEAGLPNGVLNVVTGKSSEIGDYLVTHRDIDFINFTGSTEVGKHIALIAGMVPMIMELGGKDAAIVLSDADIDNTAKSIVSGAYSYSGQRCTAVKRVLVMNSVADKLVNLMEKEIASLKVGLPQEGASITPLIDKKAADFVEDLIHDAIIKGAKLVIGNKRTGNLIYPTLFDNVSLDMRIAWEEPFGPVLPVIRVNSIDEAINIANKSKYGLQSSVFTSNINNAFMIAEKLEVGTVQINNKSERSPDHFPFLGVKSSGLGTQGIKYSIEAMTRPKVTVINLQ
jgi:glyceraldehyde-3-phosphate dehydrogenase (NADP+)